MHRQIRRIRFHFFRRNILRMQLIFWGGAILVGVVAAGFAMLGSVADNFFRALVAYNKYLPFLVTPGGFVLGVYLTRKYFSGAEGSGIPQALIALAASGSGISNRLLSIRMVVGKVFLTALALFAGGSMGREGPTVHLGAAIMHSLGKHTHLTSKHAKRGLILTGAGAGIAAAFNTPLAGVMFAIEEMARSFDRRYNGMIMVGVIVSGMAAVFVYQQNYHYYGVSPANIDFSWVWLIVVICGVVGGGLGGIFSKVLIEGSKKLSPLMQNHWAKIAFVCGIIVALLGLVSGGSAFGTGYIEAKQLIVCAGVNTCHANVSVMYPVYKILATVVTYLTSLPGGLFAPSLASGAALGQDLAMLFPSQLTSTIVILGMIGYFTGVVQTPITAFVIVMEMTDNQDLVMAMMATALIAAGTSKLISRKPVYEALAENLLVGFAEEQSREDAENERKARESA